MLTKNLVTTMAKPICSISADWHLERNAWAKHPTLAGDSYYGLQQLVDYCLNHDLPLIAAGDLFNEANPESKPVWVAAQQMTRMQQADLPVYYIEGQHERTRDTPWLAVHPWPTHVNRRSFTIGKHKFYGLNYTRTDTIQEALKAIPSSTEILVAHQVWQDLMGQKVGPECAISDVPYVRMIITGDFHCHLTVSAIGWNGQRVTMVSPGPLCMQSVSEDSHKFFYVLYDDLSLASVPLKARSFYSWDLTTEEEMAQFLNEVPTITFQNDVPPEIAKPIIRVRFEVSLNDPYVRIAKAIGDKAHFFPVPLRRDEKLSILADSDDKAFSLQTGLEDSLGQFAHKSSPEYAAALRLLRANRPADELVDMEREVLDEVAKAETNYEH